MPAWIIIAVADLDDYLVAAQMAALRNAALGGAQTDPFSRVMPDIIGRMRMKIASCEHNQLSATPNSIPPELKWAACYLIIEAMQTRLPGLKITEEQRTQIEDAKRQLDRIADCKDEVTAPNDPLDPSGIQRGGNIELVTKTPRTATNDSLNGL